MSDTVMIDTSTKKKYGISKWKGGQYGKSGYKSKGSKPYKKTSYDGIYYAKLQATFPVLVTDVIDTKNAVAGFCVAWGQNGTSGQNLQTLEDLAEYTGLTNNFMFWRLNGLKIRYLPNATQGTSAAGQQFFQIQIASFPDEHITTPSSVTGSLYKTDAKMQQQIDYRSYKGDTTVKRYYNLRKFYASRAQQWLSRTTYYPSATTILRITLGGTWVAGDRVGTVSVCWYAAFKGNYS